MGGPASFNRETQAVLRQAGYRAAFTYYGGINRFGQCEPFQIGRASIDAGLRLERFRLQNAVAGLTGKYWF